MKPSAPMRSRTRSGLILLAAKKSGLGCPSPLHIRCSARLVRVLRTFVTELLYRFVELFILNWLLDHRDGAV